MSNRYKLSHKTAILRQTLATGVHVLKRCLLLVKINPGIKSVKLKNCVVQVESKRSLPLKLRYFETDD